jgi:hypothetical protein
MVNFQFPRCFSQRETGEIMELMCPHCQQKLTIPDQYAGQLMRCPLCNGTFTAPALSAPPPPPIYSVAPEPPPPPPPAPIATEPLPVPLPDEEATLPPPLPGQLSRSLKIVFSPRVIPWITPGGLLLAILLSILPWLAAGPFQANAWQLAFSGRDMQRSDPLLAVYLILTLLVLIPAVPSCLFAVGLAPTPTFVKVLGPWRPVIVGGTAALAFLFLFIKFLDYLFLPAASTVWFKLAFRFHLLVVLASLLEFWLELRKGKNLPPPRIEMHW